MSLEFKRVADILTLAGVPIAITAIGATAGAPAEVVLAEQTTNGVNTTTIRASALMTANRVIQLPDSGIAFPAGVGGNSTMVDVQTAQAVSGVKTFTPGLVFGITSSLAPETAGAGAQLVLAEDTASGVNTMSLQAPAILAANRTITMGDANYTLPPGTVNASTLMDLQTAQTIVNQKGLGAGGGINLGGAGSLGITGGANYLSGIATTNGVNATPHNLGRIPTVYAVILDSIGAGAVAITAVSVDINNVNWTDNALGATVTIIVF